MATKIRGYHWQMNYRGFDTYYNARDERHIAVLDAGLGDARFEGGFDFAELMVQMDAYWTAKGH